MAENWGQYEVIINPLISLFLLVLAIILLVARIVMVTLFAKYRPLPYCRSTDTDSNQEPEKIPCTEQLHFLIQSHTVMIISLIFLVIFKPMNNK